MTAEITQTAQPLTLAQRNRAERKATFLAALQQHGHLTAACTATGTPRRTVYDWREDDGEFNDACEAWLTVGMEEAIIESQYELATEGASDPKRANASVRAAEIILKSINRKRYGDQLQLEQTVTINANVQVIEGFQARQREAMQQLERRALPVIEADFHELPERSETEEKV